jgi:PAS domain S-box-containing protein
MLTFLRWLAYIMLALVTLTPFAFWYLLSFDFGLSSVLVLVTISHLVLCAILYLVLSNINARARNSQIQALAASSQQFVSLYERSPIPYVTIDRKSKVVMYNPAAVRFFETTTNGFPGLSIKESIFLDNESESSILQNKIASNLTMVDKEARLRTEKGNLRWVLLSVFDYDVADYRLMSFIDITAQKAVDAAKTDFVALATHQLRTPITAIRWNVELLGRSLLSNKTPEQDNYIKKVDRNIQRMLALINDFLSVSKLEMGIFATNLEEIDLTTFGDGIIEEFEQRLVESNLTMQRNESPQNLQFTTDPRLLNIILSNLISNAVKYVPTGGVVSYSYALENKKLIFKVSDTGIGIPEDEQKQLFNKFFRARNAYAHKASGTGLGLYIVKQSVEKLNGSITVESKEGEGSSFIIELPFNP